MHCKGHREKMTEVPVGKTLVKNIEQERCSAGPEKLRVMPHGPLLTHVEEREATGRSHVTCVHTDVHISRYDCPDMWGPLKSISGTLVFLLNISLPKRKTHACKPWVGTRQEHTVSWRADCFFLLNCEYWHLSVLFFSQISTELYGATPKTSVSTYVGSLVSSVLLRPVRPGRAHWAVEKGWLLRGKSTPLSCLLPAAGEENLMTQA